MQTFVGKTKCIAGYMKVANAAQEEADSLIAVHARHAARDDTKALMIKANDTYVVVQLLSYLEIQTIMKSLKGK